MELYTGPMSPNGKRVRICAAELGISLDVKAIDLLLGEHRSPEYLALNPMGKWPTLKDGDFVLWESPAILVYLARTAGATSLPPPALPPAEPGSAPYPGGALWPAGAREEADVLRWLFFGASHLDPYFTTLVVERFIKARRREPPDPAQTTAAEQWLARFVPVVEQQLSTHEYLTGRFSVADIALGCTLELSPLLAYDLSTRPALRAWLERLQARPSWRSAAAPLVSPQGAGPTRDRFVKAYDGAEPPPWDTGVPNRDLAALFDELSLSGSALDLGCGTGEQVLELARRGIDAWGIDSTPAAIAGAEKKKAARGLTATFVQGDALDLAPLGRTFDTIVDCGLFHVLTDDERRRYVQELAHVVRPGGRHLMLGFATNPSGLGPRGYSPEELRAHFAEGWREVLVRGTTFQIVSRGVEQPTWLSVFVREG